MHHNENSVAARLQKAFISSGLTPEEFYTHIVLTRKHLIVSVRPELLSFKIQVPDYGNDLEWYGWDAKLQLWVEL